MKFKVNNNIAELIGIIIGDGNIYYNPKARKYYFEITGDPNLEKEYFNHISNLIYKILRKKPSIKQRGRGLRLRVYSKEFVTYLINTVKLPYGKIKGKTVKIPKCIKNQNLIKSCIRGITDTDGSLFLSRKGKRLNYPCIEITTTSKPLAFQLQDLLKNHYRMGFRKFSQKKFRDRYVLSINGDIMVNKWVKEIGFSNQRKLGRLNGNGGI